MGWGQSDSRIVPEKAVKIVGGKPREGGFPAEFGEPKWNKVEHRLFSQISKNWRGRPLETITVIISLISSTTTDTGLRVKCGLDTKQYQTGIKVNDEELNKVNIVKNDFHGEWNYIIMPKQITNNF